MARGGGRLQTRAAAAAPARGDRGPLGLLCLALLCALGAAEAEFSILDEAQVLASQMRKLATEELRVVTMQDQRGSLPKWPFIFSKPAAFSHLWTIIVLGGLLGLVLSWQTLSCLLSLMLRRRGFK